MSQTQESQEQIRFIRFAELQTILGGVARSTIERGVANGVLPTPYKLGSRMVAWRADEINAYLESLQRVTM